MKLLDWPAAAAAGTAHAGGKGAQLGRMAMLGLPVPDGFVIPAAAAQGHAPGAPVPPALAAVLAAELARRGWEGAALAVRSSATAEDSQGASFAGIHASVLNVCGLDGLLAAVRTVWESLQSDHARVYRHRMGLDDGAVRMAVVVMPLLPAQAAGIAFTADPVSGRADQVLIHANWGLGESLVAGQADGDEYRFRYSWRDHTLAEPACKLGAKQARTAPAPGGGTVLESASPAAARAAVLDPARREELALLAMEAAQGLDYADPAYDLEWVWDGARFWLVQARPITARPDYTYPGLRHQPVWWTRGNTIEVLPHPVTPIEWNHGRALVNHMISIGYTLAGCTLLPGVDRAALKHGKMYIQASLVQWEAWTAFGVPPGPINRLMGGSQGAIAVPPPRVRDRLRHLLHMVRYVRAARRLRKRADGILDGVRSRMAQERRRPLPAGLPALVAEMVRLRESDLQLDAICFLQGSGGGALMQLAELLDKHLPGAGYGLAAALLAGGEPSVTARQGYALMELAAIAAQDAPALAWLRDAQRVSAAWEGELPADSPFRAAFARFLEEYGHRAIAESHMRSVRWREDPSYLFDSVLNLQGADPAALRARQEAAAAAAWERIGALPWGARAAARFFARSAARELNQREAARSALVAQLEVVRRLVVEAGRRLHAQGLARAGDDVFYLAMHEVAQLVTGALAPAHAQARADERRALCAGWERTTEPPVIVLNADGAPSAAAASPRGAHWRGTAVGAGRTQGQAWIALTPQQGLGMQAGDVLVVPATDPAWTPLFLKAGALVMQTGGFLSHGAIVAREFGIPAVVGVPGILDAVAVGDLLAVDGAAGVVELLARRAQVA